MRSKALPEKRTDDDDSAPSTSSSSDDGAKCQSTQRKASGAQRKKNGALSRTLIFAFASQDLCFLNLIFKKKKLNVDCMYPFFLHDISMLSILDSPILSILHIYKIISYFIWRGLLNWDVSPVFLQFVISF